MDLSIIQDVFTNIGGKRNAGQFRIDFTNFGNLLNSNWGASQRMVVPVTAGAGAQILTNPGVDAQRPADMPPRGGGRAAGEQDVPAQHQSERRLPVHAQPSAIRSTEASAQGNTEGRRCPTRGAGLFPIRTTSAVPRSDASPRARRRLP